MAIEPLPLPPRCPDRVDSDFDFWDGLRRFSLLMLVVVLVIGVFMFALPPMNYYFEMWNRRWIP